MHQIPLFPLPVVLFPGAVIPLHIFEPRYRRMVARCLEGDRRFGLIYHDADDQGPFMNETGQVGCVAEIREHQSLPDGRWMVMVHGIHRFRIDQGLDDSQEPFYEARIAPYDDFVIPRADAIVAVRRRTLGLLHEVLGSMNPPPDEVPAFDVDSDLSFQLAPLVQVDGPWHQSLLELQDEVYRLERLDAVFQAAIDQAGPSEEGAA
jgi:Lon protease-like protein